MGPAPKHLCGYPYLTQSFQCSHLGCVEEEGFLSTSLKVDGLPDTDGFPGDGNSLAKHRTGQRCKFGVCRVLRLCHRTKR